MMAREQAPEGVRGGILADGIGFGKTTITLALMDHRRCKQLPALPEDKDLIPSRATLMQGCFWQQFVVSLVLARRKYTKSCCRN